MGGNTLVFSLPSPDSLEPEANKPEASKTGRSRVGLWSALAVVLVVVVVVLVWLLVGGRSDSTSDAGAPSTLANTKVVEQSGQSERSSSNPNLPFTVSGVDASAQLLEVSEGTQAVTLGGEWTFGGDYSLIGSFPIDENTVFGSATDNPYDVTSYRAALINQSGFTYLEEQPTTSLNTYYEPQDGSGSSQTQVWRGSLATGLPEAGTDNWILRYASEGQACTLATAEELNGTSQTPSNPGEVVPVLSGDGQQVFYSSYVQTAQDVWQIQVLAFSVESGCAVSAEPVVVGVGNYPAALDSGVLYAGGVVEEGVPGQSVPRYGALIQADLTDEGVVQSQEIFSIDSADNSWAITGVWVATAGYRAVAFTSADTTLGAYIGLWNEDFSESLAWLHVSSPSVVGAINGSWFVWGSGSQAENVGMYAFNWTTGEIHYLGEALGYSRPAIAADSNVVLIPEYQGYDQAVSFKVGSLDGVAG